MKCGLSKSTRSEVGRPTSDGGAQRSNWAVLLCTDSSWFTPLPFSFFSFFRSLLSSFQSSSNSSCILPNSFSRSASLFRRNSSLTAFLFSLRSSLFSFPAIFSDHAFFSGLCGLATGFLLTAFRRAISFCESKYAYSSHYGHSFL